MRAGAAILLLTARVLTCQPPPEWAQERHIGETVTRFAHGYLDALPDFTCIRTTTHSLARASVRDWHAQTKVSSELSYYRHEQHYRTVAVDDEPRKKVPLRIMAA